MDFHGTYGHATTALSHALELHPRDFARQLANNPQWASQEIEGPNISNVFKRTIYQILFKLRLGHQPECAGCVLALPHSVWESWQPLAYGLELPPRASVEAITTQVAACRRLFFFPTSQLGIS